MSTSEAVDLHEKTKNFLTEAEVARFLQAAKSGRHGIRDHLMMLLMYRHELRETELCRLTVSALDLETVRIWIDRLKGSLSTHHPIDGEELRAIRRYLRIRDSRLPWLFVTERGGQFTRQGVYYLVRCISERAELGRVHPHMLRHACGYALANKGMICAPSRTASAIAIRSTPPSTPEPRRSGLRTCGAETHERDPKTRCAEPSRDGDTRALSRCRHPYGTQS